VKLHVAHLRRALVHTLCTKIDLDTKHRIMPLQFAAIVVIWQMTVIHFEKHVMAWIIGAVFVMICVPLSLQDIHFHIIHYVHPLQRHYIRILWMIPGPQFTRFTSTSTKYKY